MGDCRAEQIWTTGAEGRWSGTLVRNIESALGDIWGLEVKEKVVILTDAVALPMGTRGEAEKAAHVLESRPKVVMGAADLGKAGWGWQPPSDAMKALLSGQHVVFA